MRCGSGHLRPKPVRLSRLCAVPGEAYIDSISVTPDWLVKTVHAIHAVEKTGSFVCNERSNGEVTKRSNKKPAGIVLAGYCFNVIRIGFKPMTYCLAYHYSFRCSSLNANDLGSGLSLRRGKLKFTLGVWRTVSASRHRRHSRLSWNKVPKIFLISQNPAGSFPSCGS